MDREQLASVIAAVFFLVCYGSVFVAIGAYVAKQCGRSPIEGAILGFVFGPIGALIVALLPRPQKPVSRARPSGPLIPSPERDEQADADAMAFLDGK